MARRTTPSAKPEGGKKPAKKQAKRPGKRAQKGAVRSKSQKSRDADARKAVKEAQRSVTGAIDESEASDVGQQERDRVRAAWGLDGLDPVDKEILRIKLANPSISEREIGIAVGLSRTQITRRCKRPALVRAIEDSQLSALAVISRAQVRAANRLVELVESADSVVAVRASIEIMRPALKRADLAAGGVDAFASFLEDVAKGGSAPEGGK